MLHSSLQEICALIGQPVAGNPTQYMMEKAFAHHGLDWRYLTLEVPPQWLEDALRGIRGLGFRGGNIAQPHTIAAVPYLDRLTGAAERVGAVNCVFRDKDHLIGDNTDGRVFLDALKTLVDPHGMRAVLLGAGGAARSIGVELATAGAASITVVNRSVESGQALVERLQALLPNVGFQLWEGDYTILPEADLLIHATSIGLNDAQARVPLNFSQASRDLIVADIVATPPVTHLLRKSAEHALRTLDGVGMIVQQAALALELWTGKRPDVHVMREAAEEFLGS